MLRDLTRADWLGFLDLTADQIPPVLVLRGTRNLRRHYEGYRALFGGDAAHEVGSPNALFEDICIGDYRGIGVGYASVYGAAMASEITHVFGVLGTNLVIQTGVCGALGYGILAGDLIVATSAGCGEGAAACYLPGTSAVDASPDLVTRALTAPVEMTAVPRHAGSVWTTAALLAESEADLAHWHEAGHIAVDLETASTFAVAEYFGMRRIGLLSVFDNPRQGEHLGLTETHKQEARLAGEQAMLEVVLGLIEHQASA